MKYLLDTHTLLWALDETENLSHPAELAITNSEDLYVSVATFWEIAIKKNLNKLDFDGTIQELAKTCETLGIRTLNIQPIHLDELANLPFHHKDPFDRILIAQAKSEKMTFITKDCIIPKYDIVTLW